MRLILFFVTVLAFQSSFAQYAEVIGHCEPVQGFKNKQFSGLSIQYSNKENKVVVIYIRPDDLAVIVGADVISVSEIGVVIQTVKNEIIKITKVKNSKEVFVKFIQHRFNCAVF